MGQPLWRYLEKTSLISLNFPTLGSREVIPSVHLLLGLQRALHITTDQRWPPRKSQISKTLSPVATGLTQPLEKKSLPQFSLEGLKQIPRLHLLLPAPR